MTEPPAKRQARCIEDDCEDLRALLVKSPDFWDYQAIEKVLKDIFRLEGSWYKKAKILDESTFKCTVTIMVSLQESPSRCY